uniref:ABC transporter B family member 9-like isoform X1 n=1 Tax=Rhizophora mucronata TaxID=61149 RepID=A0A2P2KL24_RHIMU
MEISETEKFIVPLTTTSRGVQESKTTARCHPFLKATKKIPMNVDGSCINFPTCDESIDKDAV